jgi:hypothetical protein
MPYIGNDIQFGELTSQSFTGDGSTTAFTLSYTVANPTSLIVTIADVIQEPTTAYTVAGTTLTCTSAPADGDTIHVRFLGRVVDVANAAILQDSDQDTKIQVEESADEDTIRFDIAGAEDFTMTANDFTALSGSTISTNTIAETTSGSGVTIDGLLVKDGSANLSSLSVQDAKLNMFTVEVFNSGGTLQARILPNLATASAAPMVIDGLQATSQSRATIPVGADGSTAFANGLKVGSGNTEYIWFDTAALTAGKDIGMMVMSFNTTGTQPLTANPIAVSIDINGTTRLRWAARIYNEASAFAINTTNIANTKLIAFENALFMPTFA